MTVTRKQLYQYCCSALRGPALGIGCNTYSETMQTQDIKLYMGLLASIPRYWAKSKGIIGLTDVVFIYATHFDYVHESLGIRSDISTIMYKHSSPSNNKAPELRYCLTPKNQFGAPWLDPRRDFSQQRVFPWYTPHPAPTHASFAAHAFRQSSNVVVWKSPISCVPPPLL